MTSTAELAHESIERTHEHHAHGDAHAASSPRRIAVLIAVLAATLAVAEMTEKSAQSEFIAHNISVSDSWAFMQAKHVRSTLYGTTAELLSSLPNQDQPQLQARIEAARRNAARLEDDPAGKEGRKQLIERAEHQVELRDHAEHRYHLLEYAVGALQIAIVLASVSVVTRIQALAIGGGAIGATAALFGLLVGANMF